MARMSRDKGQRIERELVHCHLDAGIPASRVPLSVAAGGEYAGDLHILDLRAEVKARANGKGFKQLEAWLGQHDILFLRRDRQRLQWRILCERWAPLAQQRHAFQQYERHHQCGAFRAKRADQYGAQQSRLAELRRRQSACDAGTNCGYAKASIRSSEYALSMRSCT